MKVLRRLRGYSPWSAILLAIAFFCLSPGGSALAETIVGEICGTNASLGSVTMVIIENGDHMMYGSAVIVEGTYDGQTFHGYCLDAHSGIPDECASDIEIGPSVAGAACITATYPPVVPAGSYADFVHNTAASVATWNFTDGYTFPSVDVAMTSPNWGDEAYFLEVDMGDFPEWVDAEQAFNDIRGASQSMVAACAGAAAEPLPTLLSLGNQQSNLPGGESVQVKFQTNAGAGVDLTVSVTGATLIDPPGGTVTTGADGIATITVTYSGSATATVSVSGNLPAPLGSGVGSIAGNQGFTVNVASLIFFEGSASAQVSWLGAEATVTPTDEATVTPTDEVVVTPTEPEGATPVVSETPTETETQVVIPTEQVTPTQGTIVTPQPTTPSGGGTVGRGDGGGGLIGRGHAPTGQATTTGAKVTSLPKTGTATPDSSSDEVAWLLATSSLILIAAGAMMIHRRRVS